jgi:NAD(P)-dependent dehydrogenase (short-subunit alcohol dehydrogenase family)
LDVQDSSRVWFITGSSSGLGRALAEAVLERGDAAAATARSVEALADLAGRFGDRVRPLALDVTDPGSIRAAVQEALRTFGHVDVVVNNAGFGLLGAVEELDEAELRGQMETNFFGAFLVTQALLPYLREQGGGHVVNISSEGGMMGVAGAAAYNASKFALEGFSEALEQEARPLGIKVTIVEPGAMRTDWAGRSLQQAARRVDAYAQTAGQVRRLVPGSDGQQGGDPAKVAQAIIAAVAADEPPLRLVLGTDALEHIQAKLDRVGRDLATWDLVTRSVAFDPPPAGT